jgi:tRNA(Ile)-lysidine synthetase-like protein
MNDDDGYARVRVRHVVLPALADVGPDPVGAVTRLAALVRDESTVLDAAVAAILPTFGTVRVGDALALPSAALRALPAGVARRVLRVLLGRPDADTLERLLRAPDGWRATLPGPLEVEVGRGWHVLAPPGSPDVDDGGAGLETSALHRPSGIDVLAARADGTGRRSLVARPSGGVPPGLHADRLEVALRVAGPLRLRTRRDGDRVRTPGGTRALADVMSAAGVPVLLRDRLPVVVAADDRPVWVPGLVVSEQDRDRPAAPSE